MVPDGDMNDLHEEKNASGMELDKDTLLLDLQKDSVEVHAKLDNLADIVHTLASSIKNSNFASPKRKVARSARLDFDENDMPTLTEIPTVWPTLHLPEATETAKTTEMSK